MGLRRGASPLTLTLSLQGERGWYSVGRPLGATDATGELLRGHQKQGLLIKRRENETFDVPHTTGNVSPLPPGGEGIVLGRAVGGSYRCDR